MRYNFGEIEKAEQRRRRKKNKNEPQRDNRKEKNLGILTKWFCRRDKIGQGLKSESIYKAVRKKKKKKRHSEIKTIRAEMLIGKKEIKMP